jgi:hypothetical protein
LAVGFGLVVSAIMPEGHRILSEVSALVGDSMPRKRKKKKQKPEDDEWYYDDNLWLDLLGPLIDEDDTQAERAARLLHKLIQEIQKPDGAFHVQCCLENGRRVIFPYTKFANDCKILFIESLDAPEPLTLKAITERGRSPDR